MKVNRGNQMIREDNNKQRGNKMVRENIKLNKNDERITTETMTIRELMDKKIIWNKNDDYSNLTDGVLPIQRLINNGFDVLLNDEGKVVVKVGSSENLFEGMGSHRDEDLDELKTHYVDIKGITDYNSLWEMLECGWDTPSDKRDVQYPYVSVNGKWLRWDNQILRMDMRIYEWNTENQQKYLVSIFKNQQQTPMSLPMMRTEKKVGRNEKCSCGSGKKFKKCHMNLEGK